MTPLGWLGRKTSTQTNKQRDYPWNIFQLQWWFLSKSAMQTSNKASIFFFTNLNFPSSKLRLNIIPIGIGYQVYYLDFLFLFFFPLWKVNIFLLLLSNYSLKIFYKPIWIEFQDGCHGYFWSISHPNASYQVWSQLAFGFRRGRKNRVSRWLPWRPSWISNRHDFSYFWSIRHPDASFLVQSQ